MQEQIPIYTQLLNIKIGTLIAGLLGALITMLRKSEGTLQARIVGYLTAIVTVLYVLPALIWFIQWKFNFEIHSSAEHLLAFILGMTAQRLTEHFIDDPWGSVYLWTANVKKFKRVVWNGESSSALKITPVTDSPPVNDNKVEDIK